MNKPDKPEQPQPKPITEAIGGHGASETQFLVREAAGAESADAWTALSAKIVYYLRTRFGNASFPPGTEFNDFVSDLMAKVMTSIQSFEDRGKESFWRWVQTIGGNLWRDMWRRFERDRKLGLAGRGEQDAQNDSGSISLTGMAPAKGETPTQIVRFRELESAEQQCIEKLPRQMKDVYVRRRQNELSFQEISVELGGIKEATLRSNYMRARDLVRECLARRLDELGTQTKAWKTGWS